eukprot:g862.t1
MTESTNVVKSEPILDGGIEDNEIRVTTQGRMRNYIAYARSLFSVRPSFQSTQLTNDFHSLQDKGRKTVVLKGMGRVINKTVSLAEILKRQVKGLYQRAEIGSIRIVQSGTEDENLQNSTRLLSTIEIVLTMEPEDEKYYQPPVDESKEEPMMPANPLKQRNMKQERNTKQGRKVKTSFDSGGAPLAKTRRNRRRNVGGKKASVSGDDTKASPVEKET